MFALLYGGALLLYLVAAIAVAWLFGRATRRALAGFAVFAAFFIVPATWIVYERWYFDHICAKEGGIHIIELQKNVQGFVDDWGGTLARDAARLPYSYIETREKGKWVRYSKSADGHVSREEIDRPTSQFGIRALTPQDYPKRITKWEIEVFEVKSQKRIAIDVSFSASAGPVALWRGRHRCPVYGAESGPTALLLRALIPIKLS